jgi:hypothetical protein
VREKPIGLRRWKFQTRWRWDERVRSRLSDGLTGLVEFPPRYRSALEPSGELTPTSLARIGEAAMTGVLNDLLLFSGLAAFVTGLVIAAATILI